MEVALGSAGPELVSPGDLQSFKVLVTGDVSLSSSFGVMSADGAYVFVEPEWILQHAGELGNDPSWLTGFQSMIRYAAERGWTDGSGRVRAHVEWTGTSDLGHTPR